VELFSKVMIKSYLRLYGRDHKEDILFGPVKTLNSIRQLFTELSSVSSFFYAALSQPNVKRCLLPHRQSEFCMSASD